MTDFATVTAELMPRLREDLKHLASIPSIAFPGYPAEEVHRAHDEVVNLLRDAGVDRIDRLDLPDTSPVITGHIPAPEGAPTVLLYGHYDVQPAGDESLWDSPPFTPTEIEGGKGLRGRGVADCKANIIAHIGALRVHGGRPPVGIRIVFEGQEEYGSAFDDYPPKQPELFAADAMVVADMGNVRPGEPTLTVALRGAADLVVELRTLKQPVHSGEFGGAAPDALLAMIAALATLHDADGNVAVEGLRRDAWEGTSYTDEEFAELAGMTPEARQIGTGPIGERLWHGPAITVIGLDAPAVDTAAAAVVPYARAALNLRVHPEQDVVAAQRALVKHLEKLRPMGQRLTVTAGDAGAGFAATLGGPAYTAMGSAMETAWGSRPVEMASGGSIPLVNALSKAVPDAEILMFGAEDGHCGLHAPNERVLYDELAKTVIAEAAFFDEFARRFRD
ncbi:acetylornithine deacetylase/succinyl-diaminopimelate desuccinylase-like protein [Stackebrandtia endophytica]|uniref:Acetylornithine deacetylase/succinyl-diaminopimelate desuccinylase-like protein n=1 Tax=Stackebrandtia endophytica TaxID=1496996 RepID=A0A543B436_9ACTN|nr:M20/M25/M40 family metallo-hydrolase [Stackebrandtia endophytica]TQL79587.1 acetylornithine deacetylase/succinyl-diaminopimelate desuccinylase-like protein [Stackebrandtia endophytica]